MDFTGLAEVQDAIRELGIQLEEEKDVFKALGGLLHLGQVRTVHSGRLCFGLRVVRFTACCMGPRIWMYDMPCMCPLCTRNK